jgi:hypothetical protein
MRMDRRHERSSAPCGHPDFATDLRPIANIDVLCLIGVSLVPIDRSLTTCRQVRTAEHADKHPRPYACRFRLRQHGRSSRLTGLFRNRNHGRSGREMHHDRRPVCFIRGPDFNVIEFNEGMA